MKRILFLLLVFICAGYIDLAAQPKYLVNLHEPVEMYRYTPYKFNGLDSKKVEMSGGLDWFGGFTIHCTQGPYTPGFATFNLEGKYSKMLFVLGAENSGTGAGGTGIDIEPNIIAAYADGRKVLDQVIYGYSTPKRMEIDLTGVNELKFIIVKGDITIAFGEVTLWKEGESPIETGNIINSAPKITEIGKDLKPYFYNYKFENVSPNDKLKAIHINGREYFYGLKADMNMGLVGNNPGWAYFNLRNQYSKLNFTIGPIDNQDSQGSGWFTVKADGKIIYELEMSYQDISQRVSLDVSGCEMLSFHSEQSSHSVSAGIAEIILYPKGQEALAERSEAESTVDPRLKNLPDVCKLISNIPPYSKGSQTSKQIYDGTSDHITFSMGGVKFNEGIILYEKASVLDDNTSAYAIFDLGNEFDYVSFVAGYIGKSGALINDRLKVYADDELMLDIPLMATHPNQNIIIPLNRCRRLRIENEGSSMLNAAAFGVADLVVYRGEPVENDLFVHPIPELPHTVDLIDLGAPYIHYVSPMKDSKDKIFYDGSTIRNYFELDGRRINKGFMLQTSVHFSLDHGILSGTDGAAAGAIGGAAVGASFIASGVTIGGAVVGSTLAGVAAFLMLAAGGEALENSCAAFNTYGAYNSLTFTVACYKPRLSNLVSDYKETLIIGTDQQIAAQIAVYETMEPQTITVPLNECEQLMFWLSNTDNWSGQYIFYDIVVSKDNSELILPKDARISTAIITEPIYTDKTMVEWVSPSSPGQKSVDEYLKVTRNSYYAVNDIIKKSAPDYKIHTYFLESNNGEICKAINLMHIHSENAMSIVDEYRYSAEYVDKLRDLKATYANLKLMHASALTGLPELGVKAISAGKMVKELKKLNNVYEELVDQLYQEKLAETEFLGYIVNNALNIDGKQSTETTIFCPLLEGETPPSSELQMVENFELK